MVNYDGCTVAALAATGFQARVVALAGNHADVEFSCPATGGKTTRNLPKGMVPKGLMAGYELRHGVQLRTRPQLKTRIH